MVRRDGRVRPGPRTREKGRHVWRPISRLPGDTCWDGEGWPVDSDATAFEQVVGYRQVTDAHLLTLAMRRGGSLATFDRGVGELAPSMPDAVDLIP